MRRAMIAIFVLSLAAACASPPSAPPQTSTADRAAIAASLDDRDARDLAARVNAFGFELLAELVADGDPNVVISPVSVATLLAMVLAGAAGPAAEDMAAALHLDDPAVGAEHAGLLFTLTETDDVSLEVANSLWIDGPLEPTYLERVRSVFDATADEVDLGDQATADRIDAWVADHTQGLIHGIARDLGLPNPAAVLVLLNAVYFAGTWTVQFDPDTTTEQPFDTGSGDEVTVAMMRHAPDTAEPFAYGTAGGASMLRLPYGHEQRFVMDLFLPPEKAALTDVVGSLDAEEWETLTRRLSPEQVRVALPRLDLEYAATLERALDALGMGAAFAGSADFTPMSPMNPSLDAVAHKTALIVDESGTEAAAVTGGAMAVSAPPEFRVDRPFLFAITDTRTGALLFLGAVSDPTA